VELASRGVALVEIAYGLVALAEVRHERGMNDDAQVLRRRARAAIRGCADAGILGELMMRLERRLAVEPRAASRSGTGEALSEAELAVLRLLRSDLSQREIGAELFISLNTVKTHVRNIYRKLAVATRADAVSCARQRELL
jgi:LuxR family maltose regulon positive regulatory protein